MSRFVLAVLVVIQFSAAAHAGMPLVFWPQHGPMGPDIPYETRSRTSPDGILPRGLLYGPRGPEETPAVDQRAHRRVGQGTVAFARPTINGMRLDWCLHPRVGCGPAAAHAFCTVKGFQRVVQLVGEREVGRYAPTTQIASGLSCSGRDCNGFSRIVCSRE